MFVVVSGGCTALCVWCVCVCMCGSGEFRIKKKEVHSTSLFFLIKFQCMSGCGDC